MNRRIFAGALTAALLGLILAIGSRSPSTGRGTSDVAASDPIATPEGRLRALIGAARDGDVDAYLVSFAEPLRSRVASGLDEAGRSATADAMRRASEGRKGYALHAPEPDGPDAVRIAVESVYPDRNERQVYRLVRGPDGWRVAGVDAVRGREPAARFGAPATYREPEGVPVQGIEPTEATDEAAP